MTFVANVNRGLIGDVLKIAGAGIGTAIGGPAGGAIGGRIGGAVGGAIEGGTGKLVPGLPPGAAPQAFDPQCNCGPDSICVGSCTENLFGRSSCSRCAPRSGGTVSVPGGTEAIVSVPPRPQGSNGSRAAAVGACGDCVVVTRSGRRLKGKIQKDGTCKVTRRANPGNIKARSNDLRRVKQTLNHLEKFGKVFDKTARETRPQRRAAARRVKCSRNCPPKNCTC